MRRKNLLKKCSALFTIALVIGTTLIGCSKETNKIETTTETVVSTVETVIDTTVTETDIIEDDITEEVTTEEITTETETEKEVSDEFKDPEFDINAQMVSVSEVENKDFVSLSYICLDNMGTLYNIESLYKDIEVIAQNTGLSDIAYSYKDKSTLFVLDSNNNYSIIIMENDSNTPVSIENGKLKDTFKLVDIFIDDVNEISLTVLDTETNQIYDSLDNYEINRSDIIYPNDDEIWRYSPSGAAKYVIDGTIKDELNGWVLTTDGTLYIHDAGSTIAEDEPCEYLKDIKFVDLLGISKVNDELSFAITENNELYMLYNADSDSAKENMVKAIITGFDGDVLDATYNKNAKKVVIKTTSGFYKIDYDIYNSRGITVETTATIDESYNSLDIIDMYSQVIILSDGHVLISKK